MKIWVENGLGNSGYRLWMFKIGKPKRAVCVIDGFMLNTNRQFCIKNKTYEFLWNPIEKKYLVKTEGYNDFRHNMKINFFNKYFFEIKDFITKNEMEI